MENSEAVKKLNRLHKALSNEKISLSKRVIDQLELRREGKLPQAIAAGIAIEDLNKREKAVLRPYLTLIALYMMLDNDAAEGLKKLSIGLESPCQAGGNTQLFQIPELVFSRASELIAKLLRYWALFRLLCGNLVNDK